MMMHFERTCGLSTQVLHVTQKPAVNQAVYPCLDHGISDMHPFNAPFRLEDFSRSFFIFEYLYPRVHYLRA